MTEWGLPSTFEGCLLDGLPGNEDSRQDATQPPLEPYCVVGPTRTLRPGAY